MYSRSDVADPSAGKGGPREQQATSSPGARTTGETEVRTRASGNTERISVRLRSRTSFGPAESHRQRCRPPRTEALTRRRWGDRPRVVAGGGSWDRCADWDPTGPPREPPQSGSGGSSELQGECPFLQDAGNTGFGSWEVSRSPQRLPL